MDDPTLNSGNDCKKRSFDDTEDSYQPPKRSNRKRGHLHLKILIHTNTAGAIIGKSGDTVSSIQKQTNTKIKMSKNKEYFPGTQERVCLISGDREGILGAFDIMLHKISEEKKAPEEQVRVLVPNTLAGMIIGKNGTNINLIKKESKAHIEISHRTGNDGKSHDSIERILTISGNQDQMEKALGFVLDKMEDDSSNSIPLLNLKYDNTFSKKNTSNNGNSLMGNAPSNNNLMVMSALLNQNKQPLLNINLVSNMNTPMINNLINTFSQMGFDKISLREIELALQTLHKHGLLAIIASGILNLVSKELQNTNIDINKVSVLSSLLNLLNNATNNSNNLNMENDIPSNMINDFSKFIYSNQNEHQNNANSLNGGLLSSTKSKTHSFIDSYSYGGNP